MDGALEMAKIDYNRFSPLYRMDNYLFGYRIPITGEYRNLYAIDHLNPVLYFVLIFAVPVARLFRVYGAASDCKVRKNLIIFLVFRPITCDNVIL